MKIVRICHIRFDNRKPCALLAMLLATGLLATGGIFAQDPPPPFKVMSFNIRYGTASDGDNHWDRRRHLVDEVIAVSAPDLLGVQEALRFQCQSLQERFPEYGFHGRGRNAEADEGEYSAIFFRRQRFEKIDGGHFWLSETPDVAGSRSWDSSLPRMVTWVSLRDKETDSRLVFANTHFDHRGPTARLNAAKLIRQRLVEGQALPLLLTGDFNAGFASPPWQMLAAGTVPKEPGSTAAPGNSANSEKTRRMTDTWRVIHPQRQSQEGTFGAWVGKRDGARIDWILHTPGFTTLNAAINYYQDAGRYPSDHFPVEAVIRMQ